MSGGGGFVQPSGGGYGYPSVVGGGGGGGGSGTVTSVTAADTTLNQTGTSTIDPAFAINLANANTWTAAQTLGLEDAGTNTTLRPLTLRRTTSGTAAALLGVGASFVVEDASGNADEAARADAFWLTATDGASQASMLNFAVRTANAMVDTVRVGGGTTVSQLADVDAFMSVGRGVFDSRTTDNFFISHRDMLSGTSGHVRFTAAGQVIINATTGQSVDLRHNGTTRFSVNTTGMGFFAATPVAQQAVSAVSYSVVDYATDGAAIRTHLGEIATALRNLGLGA